MASQVLAVIALFLTCCIGVWKFVARMKSEKRKLADKAREQLDNAHKNKDKSSLLDSWDSINRV